MHAEAAHQTIDHTQSRAPELRRAPNYVRATIKTPFGVHAYFFIDAAGAIRSANDHAETSLEMPA